MDKTLGLNHSFVFHNLTDFFSHDLQVFEDAYKSTYSVIVVDELERLLDFVPIGMR